MNTIAPNLTALVGELVGARLIAHGGSLLNLAKQLGSTIQILGAEKALFRALKTKHSTPKYGLIYHASLIGKASQKHKGKISRSLAAKTALAIRYDALGDGEDNSIGTESRLKLETRLQVLENKELRKSAGSTKGKPKIEAYEKEGAGALITPAKTYNPAADVVLGQSADETPKKSELASKKRKRHEVETAPSTEPAAEAIQVDGEQERKKKKKSKETEETSAAGAGGKKKKTKSKESKEESAVAAALDEPAAHLKFTVLLKPDGPERITTHTLQELQSSKDAEGDAEKGAIRQFSDLPTELLFEIFLRLEPDLVIRCSSVCKNWCSSATDTTYLEQRYQRKKQRPLILFMGDTVGDPSTRIITLNLQTLCDRDIGLNLQRACGQERHQLVNCFRLHGSCKGVLLYSFHDSLYLCNPVTKHWSQFPYNHNNSVMLFLYHHKGSNTFRILKKANIGFMQQSSYSVMELDPGASRWNERHAFNRNLNTAVNPVPIQVHDSLYFVHEENGTPFICEFDTMAETLVRHAGPPLAGNQVMFWIVLLDFNGQLAASISWAVRNPVNAPIGPAHIDLWNYRDGNWEHSLRVAIPERLGTQLMIQLGAANMGWSGFICNENGQFLFGARNLITCHNRDGDDQKAIEAGDMDHLMADASRFLSEGEPST
ncbi:unnamed protein product [Urochloa humidicola]